MTKNFTDAEFSCKCNSGKCEKAGVHGWFIENLQKLRDQIGKPLIITSGYRCRFHPAEAVKKKTTPARHQQGIAADLYCPEMDLRDLYEAAVRCQLFTGIGVNPHAGFLHLDCRPASEAADWAYNQQGQTVTWDGVWANLPKEA